MRLAPISRDQRLAAILGDLVNGKYSIRRIEINLAVEYGTAAGDAAAQELIYIDQHRDQYDSGPFEEMFEIIGRVDDKSERPLIEKFKNDTDSRIADRAKFFTQGL